MTVSRNNAKACERARAAGKLTYRLDVVETWPACVECQQRLRHMATGPWRYCGCLDVVWSYDYTAGQYQRL